MVGLLHLLASASCWNVARSLYFCFLGSAYILFGEYVHDDEAKTFNPKYTYPGVAFFLQNLFIFFASITYKFGRSEDMWG